MKLHNHSGLKKKEKKKEEVWSNSIRPLRGCALTAETCAQLPHPALVSQLRLIAATGRSPLRTSVSTDVFLQVVGRTSEFAHAVKGSAGGMLSLALQAFVFFFINVVALKVTVQIIDFEWKMDSLVKMIELKDD